MSTSQFISSCCFPSIQRNRDLRALSSAICGLIAFAANGTVFAQMPAPAWANDPGVVSESFIFLEDDPHLSGEWGELQVTVDNATNPFLGTGWQEPGDLTVSRDDNGGAYDLGPEGNITLTLNALPSPGGAYFIDYFINVIYVDSILYDVPQLSVVGYPGEPDLDDVFITEGIESSGAYAWDGRTFPGTLSGNPGEDLTFVVSTPGGTSGAVVDTVEVYARVIPEPSTYAAIFGGAALAAAVVLRRRRRMG